MRVVIIEQLNEGHYYTYVRRVVEAVKELTRDVVLLVTPQGLESREFRTNLAPVVGGIDVRASLRFPRPGTVKSSWDKVANVRRAIKETKPDVLLVPTADQTAEAVGMAQSIGLPVVPRGLHCEGLMTRLTFTYPDAIRSIPMGLVLRGLRHSPWTKIHLIDLLAYGWLKRNEPALSERFAVIPDPVERFTQHSREEARRSLNLPADGRYLVCPGILIGRKGIDRLIEAFASADARPNDRLLLAGPVGEDVAALLARDDHAALIKAGRVIVHDKYLSAEELGRAMCAGDVVCCPYPHQWHPSSIAVKALACNRPVLGADSFWLGQMVPMFQMGWTVPVNDPVAFRERIRKVLDESADWRISESARRLVEFQSVDQFKACWTTGLRAKMGLPPNPTGRTWDWVAETLDAPAQSSPPVSVHQ